MKIIKVKNLIVRKSILRTMENMGADKDLLKKAENGELTREELKVWFEQQRSRIRRGERIKGQRRKGDEIEAMPKGKNFYLGARQIKRLNAVAEKTGLAVLEIVPRAIDDYCEKVETKSKSSVKRERKKVKRGKFKQSKKKEVV